MAAIIDTNSRIQNRFLYDFLLIYLSPPPFWHLRSSFRKNMIQGQVFTNQVIYAILEVSTFRGLAECLVLPDTVHM